MNAVILLGKPGSGKGTIASRMVKEGYYHLSGSEVLRENSTSEEAKYYKEARHALDTGILISSEIINGMMTEKFKTIPKDKPVVLDGYPRTIEQASHVIDMFGIENVKVVYLDIDDSVIVERISNRLTCKNCSASFNKIGMKPKVDGVCDHCQGELYQRVDDNEETIKTRLSQYMEHTKPMIDFLKSKVLYETL